MFNAALATYDLELTVQVRHASTTLSVVILGR